MRYEDLINFNHSIISLLGDNAYWLKYSVHNNNIGKNET